MYLHVFVFFLKGAQLRRTVDTQTALVVVQDSVCGFTNVVLCKQIMNRIIERTRNMDHIYHVYVSRLLCDISAPCII